MLVAGLSDDPKHCAPSCVVPGDSLVVLTVFNDESAWSPRT